MASRKMLKDLEINETSGVDHPAHLFEGWVVMKQADLEDALDEAQSTALEKGELMADEHDFVEEADDIRKELTDLRKQLDNVIEEKNVLKAQHDLLVEARALEKAAEQAKAWETIPGVKADEVAPALRDIRKAAPEAAAVIESALDAAASALGEADIFAEAGSTASSPNGNGDAWAEIEALAHELVKDGTAGSFAKAVTVVAERNTNLYNRYLTEKGI